MRHEPGAFVKYDEIDQPKSWWRDKVNVILSLDPARLNYENNPLIHRAGHDFPEACFLLCFAAIAEIGRSPAEELANSYGCEAGGGGAVEGATVLPSTVRASINSTRVPSGS